MSGFDGVDNNKPQNASKISKEELERMKAQISPISDYDIQRRKEEMEEREKIVSNDTISYGEENENYVAHETLPKHQKNSNKVVDNLDEKPNHDDVLEQPQENASPAVSSSPTLNKGVKISKEELARLKGEIHPELKSSEGNYEPKTSNESKSFNKPNENEEFVILDDDKADNENSESQNKDDEPSNIDEEIDLPDELLDSSDDFDVESFGDDEELENNQNSEENNSEQSLVGDLREEEINEAQETQEIETSNNDVISSKDQETLDEDSQDTGVQQNQEIEYNENSSESGEADENLEAGAASVSKKDNSDKTKAEPVRTAANAELLPDDLEIYEENGTYTSNLDFSKNLSVRRVKLPLPKWPALVVVGAAALVGMVFGVIKVIENNKPPEPVTIVSAKLNDYDIVAGCVGETVNLDGLYFETVYSNGEVKRDYNVKQYISSVSRHFDSNLKIIDNENINDGAFIKFTYNGYTYRLNAKTYSYAPSKIDEVRFEGTLKPDNIVLFHNIFISVEYLYTNSNDFYGTKLLSNSDIINNLEIAFVKSGSLTVKKNGSTTHDFIVDKVEKGIDSNITVNNDYVVTGDDVQNNVIHCAKRMMYLGNNTNGIFVPAGLESGKYDMIIAYTTTDAEGNVITVAKLLSEVMNVD